MELNLNLEDSQGLDRLFDHNVALVDRESA
jgi:hypothetical protein